MPPDGVANQTNEGPLAAPAARLRIPEALLAVGVLIFAGVVLAQTLVIPVSPLYSKVGPTVFPYITVGGLALFGALLLVQAFRGGWQPTEERDVPIDWRALGWIAVGLAVNAALIVPLGFTLASALMFTVIARGFGSRRIVRDAGIGLALSLVAYFGFAKALGVSLGQGPLERLLGG